MSIRWIKINTTIKTTSPLSLFSNLSLSLFNYMKPPLIVVDIHQQSSWTATNHRRQQFWPPVAATPASIFPAKTFDSLPPMTVFGELPMGFLQRNTIPTTFSYNTITVNFFRWPFRHRFQASLLSLLFIYVNIMVSFTTLFYTFYTYRGEYM